MVMDLMGTKVALTFPVLKLWRELQNRKRQYAFSAPHIHSRVSWVPRTLMWSQIWRIRSERNCRAALQDINPCKAYLPTCAKASNGLLQGIPLPFFSLLMAPLRRPRGCGSHGWSDAVSSTAFRLAFALVGWKDKYKTEWPWDAHGDGFDRCIDASCVVALLNYSTGPISIARFDSQGQPCPNVVQPLAVGAHLSATAALS